MRIAIVNASSASVKTLRKILEEGGHRVAWVVTDGEAAVKRTRSDPPDLVLLDPTLSKSGTSEVIASLVKDKATAVLVVTSDVTRSSGKVFEALGAGALDAVCTPVEGPGGAIQGGKELLDKITRVGRLLSPGQEKRVRITRILPAISEPNPPLIAIGSSTGGPQALARILETLPPNKGLRIVIAQHLDQKFSHGLAEWLQEKCLLRVALAKEGGEFEPNTVYLAETDDHLVIGPDQRIHYSPEPKEIPYRPSVDVLFLSLERHWNKKGIAILLTGMGRDGADGLLSLKNSGWHTIVQDQKTSVVYGMPKAAFELGAAHQILPIQLIGDAIMQEIQKRGTFK